MTLHPSVELDGPGPAKHRMRQLSKDVVLSWLALEVLGCAAEGR